MSTKKAGCCDTGDGRGTACCATGRTAGGEEQRRLLIELMYIDLSTCDRCLGTEACLDEAVAEVQAVLGSVGYALEVRKVLVESEEQAAALAFMSSPTIRINGQDVQMDFQESDCGCCGDIAGESVDCRVWHWRGQEYTAPPKAMLVDAILRHVYGGAAAGPVMVSSGTTVVPENLRRFFAAKNKKA